MPAPTRVVIGGERCSVGGAGTSSGSDSCSPAAAGPRRTTLLHGSRSVGTMLPVGTFGARSAAMRSQSTTRLFPTERRPSIGCAGRHGLPSIVAGKAPVSCVKVTAPPAAMSRTPWCNSTAWSSIRIAAVAARPRACRPGGSVIDRSHAGPTEMAMRTPSGRPGDWTIGVVGRATVTVEPTLNPVRTRRSCAATGRPSIASVVVGGRSSARTRSATESVDACGWTTKRSPWGPVASQVGSCSMPTSGRDASTSGTLDPHR